MMDLADNIKLADSTEAALSSYDVSGVATMDNLRITHHASWYHSIL
jgi:hypothetical protein